MTNKRQIEGESHPDASTNVPAPEWRAIRRHRPNMLLEGGESDVEAALVVLSADLGLVDLWPLEGDPAGDHRASTLVVRHVDSLSPDDQEKLLSLMDQMDGRIRVVATSAVPLFERVNRGAFSDRLYYRLAAIRIVVGSGPVSGLP